MPQQTPSGSNSATPSSASTGSTGSDSASPLSASPLTEGPVSEGPVSATARNQVPHQEHWQRIDKALADALEQPAEKQLPFLEEALKESPEALASAKKLLAQSEAAERLFAQSPNAHWQSFGAGTRLGPWQLVRQLGAGGMGVVWLARRVDGEVEMQAAIKLLPPSLAGPLGADAQFRQRFLQEKQILAKLQHPHIARLLEASTSKTEIAHFVMEYVEGQPLLVYCQGRPLAEKLALFQQICRALQYAHGLLVVHRDLKPQNILVTLDGEPKVLDFGIGKILKETAGDGSATMQSAFSLDYASPEQIAAAPVGTATDIYSLGLLLYEMVTGVRARRMQGQAMEIAAKEITRYVAPPHPELPEDLLAIVRKASHADAGLRYSTALALAEDVQRYGQGLPVQARRNTAARRAGLFLRRNWLPVAASFGLAALIIGLALQAWFAAVEANRNLETARQMQKLAEQQKSIAETERARAEAQSVRLQNSLLAESQQRQLALQMEAAANQQRQKAEANLRELLSIFGSVTQSARTDVSRLTGGLPAAIRLTEDSLNRLERLSVTGAARNSSLYLRAEAHERLAEFFGGANGNVGDPARSAKELRQANAIWQELHRADPGNPAVESRFLWSQYEAAFLSPRKAMSPAEFDSWEARFAALSNRWPNRRPALAAQARFYFRSSLDRSAGTDNSQNEFMRFSKAMAIFQKLADQKDPQLYEEDLRNLALTLKYLAGLRVTPDQERTPYAERACAIDRQRVALTPSNFQARMDLAFSLSSLADQYAKPKPKEAIALYRESALLRREAARLDPTNAFVLRSQVYPHRFWCWNSQRIGDWKSLEEAVASYEAAAAIAKPPLTPQQQQELLYFKGKLLLEKQDVSGACALFARISPATLEKNEELAAGLKADQVRCQ